LIGAATARYAAGLTELEETFVEPSVWADGSVIIDGLDPSTGIARILT